MEDRGFDQGGEDAVEVVGECGFSGGGWAGEGED